MLDSIISQRVEFLAQKPNLNPPFSIEVLVPSHKFERSSGVWILHVSTMFQMILEFVRTVWYFCFPFYCHL